MAGRRFALYFCWSRPGEAEASLGTLENRYPALFEFRRTIWPHYEHAKVPERFNQMILGFLDHVILFDFTRFRNSIASLTGYAPQVIQRQADDGVISFLDDNLFDSVDTLIIVSLDHVRTNQSASEAEITALSRFLSREESCIVVCPHHNIGSTGSEDDRIVEHLHHGDMLIPAQQQIGGFALSLLAGLGYPIESQYGLNPEQLNGEPAPLKIDQAGDELNILRGVETFNRHPHLPHLLVPVSIRDQVKVMARQSINPDAPRHPFTDAGNSLFNALLWLPPSGARRGNVFVCDATLWSSAFGGDKSLSSFWRNLAHLKV